MSPCIIDISSASVKPVFWIHVQIILKLFTKHWNFWATAMIYSNPGTVYLKSGQPQKFGMWTPYTIDISHWRDCWEVTSLALCGMYVPKWKNCQIWVDPCHFLQDQIPSKELELHRGGLSSSFGRVIQGTLKLSSLSPYLPLAAPVPWYHPFELRLPL